MKHKTSELTGTLLDAAVAKAEGRNLAEPIYSAHGDSERDWSPSTEWAAGGPIIERERIATAHDVITGWRASHWRDPIRFTGHIMTGGETPLIAAMRAYVASKLGDEVELGEGAK